MPLSLVLSDTPVGISKILYDLYNSLFRFGNFRVFSTDSDAKQILIFSVQIPEFTLICWYRYETLYQVQITRFTGCSCVCPTCMCCGTCLIIFGNSCNGCTSPWTLATWYIATSRFVSTVCASFYVFWSTVL